MIIDGMSGSNREQVFKAIKENKDNIKSGNYGELYSHLMLINISQIGAITELLCKSGGVTPQEIVNSINSGELPAGLFYNNDLTKITLPANIDHIFYGCFYNCYQLEKVNLNSQTLFISSEAFVGCKNLKEFDFNAVSSSLYLGDKSFAYSGIEKVDLPVNTVVDKDCFRYCNNLKEVIIQADKYNFTRVNGNYAKAFTDTTLDKFTIKGAVLELIIGHKYTGELSSADGVKLINYFGFMPSSNGCDIGVI